MLATFAFAAFLCAIIAQVVYRYVGISMVWSEEMARMLNVYMVFLGLITVTHRGGHLKIDVLERMISSPRALWMLRLIHYLLALAVLICFAWGSYLLMVSSWGHRLASMAWANHGMFYLAPTIGCLLSAVLIIFKILDAYVTNPNQLEEF